MNSDTDEELRDIARQAGVSEPCTICGNYQVRVWDDDAKDRAFAMATNAWKTGLFGGSSREEIIEALDGVISDINHNCPSCGNA